MIHIILFIDWNTGIYLHSKAHKMTLWKFNEIQINNLNKKWQQQQQQTAALQHVYKSGKRKGTKRQGKKPILSALCSICRENCFFWDMFFPGAIVKSKRIVGKVFFLQDCADGWLVFLLVLFFVFFFCLHCTQCVCAQTVPYLPLFWSFFVSSVIFVWLNTCKCRRCERDSFGCDN